MTAPTVDRPGKELPKYWKDIATAILEHPGWGYEKRTKHPQIISPAGLRCSLPTTVTDGHAGHRASYLVALKRIGAPINQDGAVTPPERQPRTVTPSDDAALMALAPRTHIDPISTLGQWWHPLPEPEPEPVPEVAPPVVERRYTPRPMVRSKPTLDPDAQGSTYSLGQARAMLRQGYHINKVVQRTGWGRNWLDDLVDDTGFLSDAHPVAG